MSKELYVRREDYPKRVSYLIKEFIKDSKEINVVSSHLGANVVASVCNRLENDMWVNIADIQTKTEVRNEKRKLSFVIRLTKSKDFDRLYDEAAKRKAEYEAQRKEKKEDVKV